MRDLTGGKRIFVTVAIAGVFLGAARGQAGAWGNTWMGAALEQAVNAARGKAGGVRYNAALQLVDAGYDSDIYFGSLDHRVPDVTFAVGPNVRAYFPIKKTLVLEIAEFLRYVYYHKTENWRSVDSTFDGAAHLVVDKLYFRAGGGLVNARERLSTELPVNVRVNEANVSGLAFWQASQATAFSLQYRRTTYNYENLTPEFPDIRANLDRTEDIGDLIAYLQQRSRVRFYLKGEYGSYVFKDISQSYKNSRSWAGFAGVEFLPPETGFEGWTSGTRGSITLGYKLLDFLNPLLKDYSAPAGNIEVSTGIARLTALRLFFTMGTQFSAYTGLSFFLQTAYGAGLSRSLTKHILFTYDFGYSRNKYPEEAVPGSNPNGISADRYWINSLRLNFEVRRDLEFDLLANISRRESVFISTKTSDRIFVGFSLRYGHPAGGTAMPPGPFF